MVEELDVAKAPWGHGAGATDEPPGAAFVHLLLETCCAVSASCYNENTKFIELDRSRSNCVELEQREISRKKPINYEEWSKSIELDRTLTPNLAIA